MNDVVLPNVLDRIIDMARHESIDITEAASAIAIRIICSMCLEDYIAQPGLEECMYNHLVYITSNTFAARAEFIKLADTTLLELCEKSKIRDKDMANELSSIRASIREVYANGVSKQAPWLLRDVLSIDAWLIYVFVCVQNIFIRINRYREDYNNIVEEACVGLRYVYLCVCDTGQAYKECNSVLTGNDVAINKPTWWFGLPSRFRKAKQWSRNNNLYDRLSAFKNICENDQKLFSKYISKRCSEEGSDVHVSELIYILHQILDYMVIIVRNTDPAYHVDLSEDMRISIRLNM